MSVTPEKIVHEVAPLDSQPLFRVLPGRVDAQPAYIEVDLSAGTYFATTLPNDDDDFPDAPHILRISVSNRISYAGISEVFQSDEFHDLATMLFEGKCSAATRKAAQGAMFLIANDIYKSSVLGKSLIERVMAMKNPKRRVRS